METLRDLRSLPSIEVLLQLPRVQAWLPVYGRPLVLGALREVLEEVRQRFPAEAVVPAQEELLQRARQR
ncbi:MAG TPA: hypothetical protein VJL34_09170, partial [Anaerolineales bacterium]|nr:hypothetical protein [Anaerolineales bacterium]